MLNYRIEEKPEMILTGYKQRFHGVPYGQERLDQEHDFFVSTRAKQWLLYGATWENRYVHYQIITNIDDDGYDHYFAEPLSQWTREAMGVPEVTGVACLDQLGFDDVVIPAQTYVVFETERCTHPIEAYTDIRERIVSQWLPSSEYQLAEGPEIVKTYWPCGGPDKYMEIWLPIERKA